MIDPRPPTPPSAPSSAVSPVPGLKRRWWTLGLPLAFSLAIHAIIAGAALVLTWQLIAPPSGSNSEEVYLSLSSPSSILRTEPVAEAPHTPPPDATPVPPAPADPPPRRSAGAPLRPAAVYTPAPGLDRRTPTPAGDPPLRRRSSGPTAAIPDGAATAGLGVRFAGLAARQAKSVVYVVDASGPMVSSLPLLLAEVRRSVGALVPTQRFSVVLFRDPTVEPPQPGPDGVVALIPTTDEPRVMVFQPTLVDATPRQAGRLADWFAGVTPRGRSNPLDGLRAAIALKPQVIFLLTRSIERSGGGQWAQGKARTLDELDRLNPIDPATGQRRVIIKTIQFLDHDPTGIMQRIAEQHGSPNPEADIGYRLLNRDELGGR